MSNKRIRRIIWVEKFILLECVWESIKTWEGRWFAEGQNYIDQLHQDIEIRRIGSKIGDRAGVSQVEIERFPGKIRIVVNTAKPGILIGRKGETVKILRKDLEDLTSKKIDLEIREIKNPDCDALLISENIASKLNDASAIDVQ